MTLADGAVSVLHMPVRLDGRIAAYPSHLRGEAVVNIYLLREGDSALLIDTGFSAHEDDVLSWLAGQLPADHRLGVITLRQSEFDSVCNVVPIVNRFNVTEVFGAQSQGMIWFGFRPDRRLDGRAETVPYTVIRQDPITFLGDPARPVEVIQPALRLLTTHWLFDPSSRTLFTSDAFGHLDGISPRNVTVGELTTYLVNTRYWWLAGARTGPIIDWLDSVFATRRVDRIAPAYGPLLEGPELRSTVQAYRGALRELADRRSAAPEMGRVPA
ncbi:hypothetical protein ACWDTP_24725 [Mycobacterium sp. NPDC003449]